MAKTRRLMAESLPLIDGVAEIIDARIPISSRNPDLDEIVKDKPRIVLMNKADIADAEANKNGLNFLRSAEPRRCPSTVKRERVSADLPIR